MSEAPPVAPHPWHDDLVTLASSVVSGALVLGVGGRVAMAALPLMRGAPSRFSWSGSLEVVLLGAIYGMVGGALLALVRRRWPGAAGGALARRALARRALARRALARGAVARGALVGGALCATAWGTSPVGRSTARAAPEPIAVLIAVSVVPFLCYGALASAWADAWIRRRHRGAANASPVNRS